MSEETVREFYERWSQQMDIRPLLERYIYNCERYGGLPIVRKKMNTARLENWYMGWTSQHNSPYDPPELRQYILSGEVYGHPSFTEGDRVTTSVIKEVKGKVVETNNTQYELGTPDPEYVKYCKAEGHHVPTPEEPIKVHG